ncbi:MAG: hypothetical protein A2148_07555 [Chloroflexi bacterium RBG_16_68_14]|nr:MAG: hypothetical protein A2148_07555 [Chloroflexi bacterium RBG_16_68_14]
MTPAEFVRKWAASAGKETASYQEHFVDLCRLLNEETPNEADPSGSFYAFQKGAKEPDGDGFADVWLDKHFAWEYKTKKKHKTLEAAYKQVQTYREALGNPPLLVVSDFDRFEVHTNWTYTESWIYRFRNADIVSSEPVQVDTIAGQPAKGAPSLTALEALKALFEDSERLKPGRTTDQITKDAARLFGEISDVLRKWKVDDMRIARFITKVMFCMFATDVGLLPPQTFSDVIAVHKSSGDNKGFRMHLAELFKVMRKGGSFSMRHVPYFDGRLFEDSDVPEKITTQEILTLAQLDELNWADVEPSIFGTLFVRILDPAQRKKLGAVYTSRADIELIVEPVLMAPLRREWERVRNKAETLLDPYERKGKAGEKKAASLLRAFHEQLAGLRIVDPACGSGNFLYVSLALLKALEKEVIAFAGLHGVSLKPRVHPRQLYGIETNPYAHELASVVIWIGYLQWKHRNAMPLDDEEPILEPLDQVNLMDAVLDVSKEKVPAEPQWPDVDVIVGNPPFVGGKKLRSALGDDYVDKLFEVWDGRVPREADFCCYWFEKARAAVEAGSAKRVGLLATNSIRQAQNRRVLERIKETGDIFYAQADRKWIQDGVAVRVSMVGFDDGTETRRLLNESPDDDPQHALARARPVEGINANLTTGGLDVTQARRLKENVGICFQGPVVVGPFDIDGAAARRMLETPNPHGKPNSLVMFPVVNASDIARRPSGRSIIDFGQMSETEAALFEAPFEYVLRHVKPLRDKNRDSQRRRYWWRHGRAGTDLRAALAGKNRFIATPRVAKHRFFVWLPAGTVPDSRVFAFARSDDYFLGVLQSHVHEVWALATSSRHGVGNDPTYNNTTCFETFPFPRPSPEQEQAIAAAARELNELRQEWLNPSLSSGVGMEEELKKRTLTNLYNERPTWLVNAHRALDDAVMAAYGWNDNPDEMTILARLLELNQHREPVEAQ